MLTMVYGFNFVDRQIVGILGPFIQNDLNISDTQFGLLVGFAFAALYTIMGIPIAIIADKVNRVSLISISLAVWSGFTALTGTAQNFVQILLARVGVGIGEAGGSPPSHSIISDVYPKEERAGALGVYSLGIPLGIMSAYFVTAALLGLGKGETVPWRRIFIILGLIGVGFALILKLLIKEPPRGAAELQKGKQAVKIPLKEAVPLLLKIPSWWWMALGIASGSFAAYAFSGFQTKFLIALDPSYDFQKLVMWLGVINGIAYTSGTFYGARLVDKLGKKDVRAYGWAPFAAMMLAFPFAAGSFWVGSVNAHLLMTVGTLFCLGIYLGPSFAIAQTLAPTHIRATSTALFFFVLNMIAMGGGPFTAGLLMDMFAVNADNLPKEEFVITREYYEAVRLAMTLICLAFIAAMVCFFMVTRYLPKDWAEAEKRNEADAQA
ncbi:MAG: MFS transporter [Hellea sp.]|nr:MFS transporter [Hellea sp.]